MLFQWQSKVVVWVFFTHISIYIFFYFVELALIQNNYEISARKMIKMVRINIVEMCKVFTKYCTIKIYLHVVLVIPVKNIKTCKMVKLNKTDTVCRMGKSSSSKKNTCLVWITFALWCKIWIFSFFLHFKILQNSELSYLINAKSSANTDILKRL